MSAKNDHDQHRSRGYAIILAAALLVLLGMIAVVTLSVARIDRQATHQYSANVQADLLLDGVAAMIEGALADDARGGSIDSSDSDRFLAERVPSHVQGRYQWPAISGALAGEGFESPSDGRRMLSRRDAAPASITVHGRSFPSLEFGADGSIHAADTDGDGIADAGYWPLPVGTLHGLRWYAAIRIIDNNSAFNLSLASRSAASPIFPTQVDLEGLLHGTAAQRSAQLDQLNHWRAGNAAIGMETISDAGAARDDVRFSSDAEALWMQLGRRIANPGFNQIGRRFRAIPLSDEMTLAYPFGVRSASSAPAVAEWRLSSSLVDGVRTGSFASDAAGAWGDSLFGYQRDGGSATRNSLRTLVTTRNPVSRAGRASLNTADFSELWRAFKEVMCEASGATPFGDRGAADFNPYDPAHPQRMFRSSLRDVRYPAGGFDAGTLRLPPDQQLLLRAALAAVNAIDLRDSDADITSRRITLHAIIDGETRDVEAIVYGTEAQPYITEVYASTDCNAPDETASNPKGYVAVELHNPYPYDLRLSDYQLGVVDRSPRPQGIAPSLHLKAVTDENGLHDANGEAPLVPANGYLLLENYVELAKRTPDDQHAAYFRPGGSNLDTHGSLSPMLPDGTRRASIYVRNLHLVMQDSSGAASGGELVLLRPRRADGLASSDPATGIAERQGPSGAWNLHELVPLDQHDFAGVILYPPEPWPVAQNIAVYHYARASGGAHDSPENAAWRFVYPGRYDGARASRRHEGATLRRMNESPSTPFIQTRLGDRNPHGSYPHPFPPVQLSNIGWPGPNPTRDPATGAPAPLPHRFPFGSFARAGDVLQVPYIGAYRVRLIETAGKSPEIFLEMNAVSTDCAFADDGDPASDTGENIGRFCPIQTAAGPGQVDDLNAAGAYAPASDQPGWRYHWAMDVLGRFETIANPSGEYLPSVDPSAPIEGLINVNTAPWPLIASLHLAPGATPAQQEALARAIVQHRMAHGPFRTLFDLNAVQSADGKLSFANGWGTIPLERDLNDASGDLSPAGVDTDGAVGDFEQQFLMVTRASNLLTTRSDSFTCYLLLEGWRDAGTAAAETAVRRRGVVIFDRSRIGPDGAGMKRMPIPVR